MDALNQYSSREYSYYSEDILKVGDLVNAPVRDTFVKAKVIAVDVPEEEVAAYKDNLKVIPAGSVIAENPVTGYTDTVPGPITITDNAWPATTEEAPASVIAGIAQEIASRPITTAITNIAPADDPVVKKFADEARGLLRYAQARNITSNEQLAPATEDLSFIARLTKALKDKREEYVRPIKDQLDAVNAAFKTFMQPLEEADKLTRQQILAFRHEQERRRAEADDIEAQKMELARREAELKGGEITVDLTPVERPEAAPAKVHTAVGSASTMKVRKWDLVDIKAVPVEYLTVDAAKITKLVKAGIGAIPGIRIFEDETLRVNTR
jgi:hypothetical protein